MVDESDWNPDDPVLKSPKAAFEHDAITRWHRANVPAKEIMSMLKLRGTQMMKKLEQAIHDEKQAEAKGLDIHNPAIDKEELN